MSELLTMESALAQAVVALADLYDADLILPGRSISMELQHELGPTEKGLKPAVREMRKLCGEDRLNQEIAS